MVSIFLQRDGNVKDSLLIKNVSDLLWDGRERKLGSRRYNINKYMQLKVLNYDHSPPFHHHCIVYQLCHFVIRILKTSENIVIPDNSPAYLPGNKLFLASSSWNQNPVVQSPDGNDNHKQRESPTTYFILSFGAFF